VQKRIFTNFKTLGREFLIYGSSCIMSSGSAQLQLVMII